MGADSGKVEQPEQEKGSEQQVEQVDQEAASVQRTLVGLSAAAIVGAPLMAAARPALRRSIGVTSAHCNAVHSHE